MQDDRNTLQIVAQRSWYSDPLRPQIGIFIKRGGAFGVDITMERKNEGEMIDPVIKIQPEEAQELMDSLWTCGIRPAEGAGSVGQLSAVERHLRDMRALASSFAGVKLP